MRSFFITKNKVVPMNIIDVELDKLKPYENNPRFNDEGVEKVANSIKEFGFKNPIILDKDNVIVCGHTRWKAAQKLGLKYVPCIIADDLTPEQVKAFRLVDNKTAEFSDWDMDALNQELANILDFDMSLFGFMDDMPDIDLDITGNKYSTNIQIPQYEITGECPALEALVDEEKTNSLLGKIEQANIPEDIKAFLRKAATRHYAFNYKNIAEYYAHAPAEIQELMEESALVIIDYDNAIRNGYVQLSEDLKSLVESEEENA